MKHLSILGSTGSIGTQTLDIVKHNPSEFKIIGLTTNKNIELLKKQIREFKPEAVAVMDSEKADLLKEDADINVYSGIDGIIKEDKLGLDAIYLQAKRWDSTVGRPEIQKIAGALQGVRAKKGIFITTADFSKEALDYTARIDTKIVLIDGETLAQHMIDYDVGVSRIASYEVKKIDSDYFAEE